MNIEETIKREILLQYKSVRAFTQAINTPYSTIDSMLKKGVSGTSVQTVIRVCNSLGFDISAISNEILNKSNFEKKSPLTCESSLSKDALEVAEAYENADYKSKNIARQALDLPPLKTQNNMEVAKESYIEKELQAYRKELEAEEKGKTLPASDESKGA